MVPYATLLIPLYVLLNSLGLQNSLVGLSLVLAMFQLPFATYMMRISFEAVPRELEESALVDGCGTFGVLWRILLPAVRPGLITVGLFAFLAAWNDFFAPLILLTDSDQADAAARGRQPPPADDGRHRLRRDGGRRGGHGAALPDAVPAPPAPLRARLHVRRGQGMTKPGCEPLGAGIRLKDEDLAPCSPAAHSRLTSGLQLEQALLPHRCRRCAWR